MKTHYIELTRDDTMQEGDLYSFQGSLRFVENPNASGHRGSTNATYYRPTPDAFKVRTLPIDKPESEGIGRNEEVIYLRDGEWFYRSVSALPDGAAWLPIFVGLIPSDYDKLTDAGLILLPDRHAEPVSEQDAIVAAARALIDHVSADDLKGRRLAADLRKLVGSDEDEEVGF